MNWVEGEIAGVVLKQAVKHRDSRGWLSELFRKDELPSENIPVMGYVSATHPGISRGPHEHKEQTDIFGFMGPGTYRVRMWDNRKQSATFGRTLTVLAGEDSPMIIVIPPGIVHAYTNISKVDGLVLNFANRLYAGEGRKHPVDEIRYENDANSNFVI